ncbi:FUSC family protein [Pseudaminobacter sp. 19-2017]|uniref:FUSC family protein n=1 Tax=Pseudaminobacter soli (ex Zhang et al. 2022) TaxID=2831468 RepID=A0A942E3V2_9HYPH|nr:FUSC family protein [Pseudaminobacter soli]MBS3652507.1 FUSC family protein [Pseudaminobacter soli]
MPQLKMHTLNIWLARNRLRWVHALRMIVAGVCALLAISALGLPHAFWAVITAIMVTQSNVGGSLRTTFEQFAGSLSGAAYGAAVALLFPGDDLPSAVIALSLALTAPSIMAAVSPGFRVAPITAAFMVLAYPRAAGPVGVAAERMLEVVIGCSVGLLVSVIVMPTRASRSVAEIAARLSELLAGQLEAMAAGVQGRRTRVGPLAVRTREDLNLLEELVNEATQERRVWLSDVPDATPLLRTMRRLRHDVDMLRRASREAGPQPLPEGASEAWLRATECIAASLRGAGAMLSGRKPPRNTGAVAEAVRAYRAALDQMRRSGATGTLSTASLGRLFGIGFAFDQLRRDLDDLVARSADFSAIR